MIEGISVGVVLEEGIGDELAAVDTLGMQLGETEADEVGLEVGEGRALGDTLGIGEILGVRLGDGDTDFEGIT